MRIQTVWQSSKAAIFKDDIPDLLRVQESMHWRVVVCESDIHLSEFKHLYTQIKRKGYTCRSIKLYFDGRLPNLAPYGYVHEGEWFVYPHTEIDVAGIPYGKNEWCLLIEKRTGHGVPMQVLDHIPIYREDYQTTFWKGNIS